MKKLTKHTINPHLKYSFVAFF